MENRQDRVVCHFQYSGRPLALIAGLALATLALLAFAPGPPVLRALGAAWTVAAALHAMRRLPLFPFGHGPVALVVRASGEIALRSAGGEWRAGALRDGGFVAPWLVILRWRPEGARRDRTLLVLPGMAPAQELRKIRVILRWR